MSTKVKFFVGAGEPLSFANPVTASIHIENTPSNKKDKYQISCHSILRSGLYYSNSYYPRNLAYESYLFYKIPDNISSLVNMFQGVRVRNLLKPSDDFYKLSELVVDHPYEVVKLVIDILEPFKENLLKENIILNKTYSTFFASEDPYIQSMLLGEKRFEVQYV